MDYNNPGPDICTQCGKKRRYKYGKAVECDHDLARLKGIDWAECKRECLEAAEHAEAPV